MIKKKIIIKKKKNFNLVTFYNEDHTLGNVLRFLIAGNPEVKFVGYNVPHPSEKIMNLKIVTNVSNSIEPIFLSLKNSSEMAVLTGNFFDLSIENNSRNCY
ncbi:DNA-deirected RNA polymerases I and III 16kDa polypeptide (nucleomorph) [Chroomonas mesostigmatica CCMP1168]|uniref:DNA-deirected RNA polymerases I and III 16kDa polypeptide n=1 Tax=Chroomonas mesostigmatica CCMP1168 TaxID=1195612 RepID=J7GA03_9CRYP|nr:DNA-deirected RNA polymerases I and III 16kDa polypeptide [Chroomonas mesostigmatica CCMP1168]